MKVMKTPSPFGTRTRTRALLALRLLSSSHPRELARLLDVPLSMVQRALASLEGDGLVVARTVGRTRVFTLNPRDVARDELERYLLQLSESDEELRNAVAQVRRRPRRTGKPG